jgi:hypothetical protein
MSACESVRQVSSPEQPAEYHVIPLELSVAELFARLGSSAEVYVTTKVDVRS